MKHGWSFCFFESYGNNAPLLIIAGVHVTGVALVQLEYNTRVLCSSPVSLNMTHDFKR